MNIVLGNVEEVKRPANDENPEVRTFEMLFVRGDNIIIAAPPSRFASH